MKNKNDGKWRCPICKVEADVKGQELHVNIVGIFGYRRPLHPDCELGNDLDHINFHKLERIG